MKKIEPLLDNIIIEKVAEESASGIIIPEDMQKRDSGKGRVLAVGQGIRRPDGVLMPLLVNKGDIILYTRCFPVTIEKVEYFITKEEWILAILKDETTKQGKSK